MRELSCDVLVAGGGIAGIAAALAAARSGADVILAEKQCVLGGLATSGLVTIYLPLCDGEGTQLSHGIAEELLRLSIRHGAQDRNPEPWLRGTDREARKKVRYEAQFNPAYFMLESEALLLRAGVRILYDTRLCGVDVRGQRIRAAEAEDEEGRVRIRCRAAVDASGSAVLYRLCGEETRQNPAGNPVAGWYYASEREGLKLKMLGFADGAFGGMNADARFGGARAEEVNQFLYMSHERTLQDLKKREAEDESFIEPALLASMPQLRMICRIKGRKDMRYRDEGVSVPHSIGMVGDWRRRGPKFEVPYEALYGRIENLYAAGRIVSCDDCEMWDVMRVIPCCAVTGEAAGIAAALTGSSRPSAEAVQNALRRAGQKLHFGELDDAYCDIPFEWSQPKASERA